MQIERIIYHIKTIIITNISYKCLFILHCIIWMKVCIVAICILQFIIISFGKQCSISFYKNSSGRQKDKQMCSTDTEKQGKRYKGSDKFQILTFQTVRYWTCSDGLSASCDIYCTKTLDAQNTFCSDKRRERLRKTIWSTFWQDLLIFKDKLSVLIKYVSRYILYKRDIIPKVYLNQVHY